MASRSNSSVSFLSPSCPRPTPYMRWKAETLLSRNSSLFRKQHIHELQVNLSHGLLVHKLYLNSIVKKPRRAPSELRRPIKKVTKAIGRSFSSWDQAASLSPWD